MCANPNTLLCRFYGLHRIKLPHGRKIHFVVMGNVFPTNKDVHETYDLKGSTFGRVTNEEEIAKNPHAVLKDLNWVQREKRLELGKIKRSLLLDQLHRDVEVKSKFVRQKSISVVSSILICLSCWPNLTLWTIVY